MKKQRFVVIITLIAILLPIFIQYTHIDITNVELGVLDIRHWDFNDEPTVEIEGEWEVYNKTLNLDEIVNYTPDNYEDINEFNEDIYGEISVIEATTYHLKILNDNPGNFGMIIDDFYNDYRLYINGVLKVDKTYDGCVDDCSSEKQKNNVIYFNSEGDIDLVFQVYRNSELKDKKWSSVIFGTDNQIRSLYESDLGSDYILIGNSIMIASLFGCIFFISKDYYKYTLGYLSLFGFNLAFGALMTGERIITNLFNYADYSFIFKGQQVFYHLTILLLFLLVDSYFKIAQKSTVNFVIRYTAVALALVIFLPVDYYKLIMTVLYIISFIIEFYVLHILYKAYNSHYPDVVELLCGYMIILVFTLNDALHSMQVIETGFIINTGLAIFIYINAIIIFTKYLTQSIKAEHLSKEVKELNKTIDQKVNNRTKQLKEKAEKDSLTKLFNHEHLFEELKRIHRESRFKNRTYSILMLDIDYFKKVNDVYGHQAGDDVLKKIASYLNTYKRHGDIVGRYGGEEFMMILPDTGIENAYKVAEKHRIGISELEFSNDDIKITVSIGVAEYEDGITPQEIVSVVDQRMYKAKASGRNNTVKD